MFYVFSDDGKLTIYGGAEPLQDLAVHVAMLVRRPVEPGELASITLPDGVVSFVRVPPTMSADDLFVELSKGIGPETKVYDSRPERVRS